MALWFNFPLMRYEVLFNTYFIVVVKFCVQFAVHAKFMNSEANYDKHWTSELCIIFIHERYINYQSNICIVYDFTLFNAVNEITFTFQIFTFSVLS